MADTIGDLLRFSNGGQLGVTQGMGPPPAPDIPGLPPELLAMRPQVQQGPKWAQVIGRIGDTLALMAGGRAHYGNQIREDQAAQDDWDQRVALEQFKARQRLEEQRAKAMQPPEPTSLMQNFQFLRDRYGDDFAKDFVMKPTFVQNWDGTRTQVGGGGDDGGSYTDPETGETYDFIGGDRNDPNAWRPRGGAGGNVSGGFPR